MSYYQDPDEVAALLRSVGTSLTDDPRFAPLVLEPLEILGVDGFTEWSAVMKARVKTVPLKQWEVGRELRRRIVKAFVEHGFPIPFPVPASAVPPADRRHEP